jgi:hypothetical protein
MNNKTPTPRADEWHMQLEHCIDVSSMTYTKAFLEMADFARQLERELTAEKKRAEGSVCAAIAAFAKLKEENQKD